MLVKICYSYYYMSVLVEVTINTYPSEIHVYHGGHSGSASIKILNGKKGNDNLQEQDLNGQDSQKSKF